MPADSPVVAQPGAQKAMTPANAEPAPLAPAPAKQSLLRLRGGIGPCCAIIDGCLCCCALEECCCCGLAELC
ncbi:uncharacterized protein LOC62_01G000911 [Vanrija pseudolonga]|uniref:Uncharacterized protein n=1 Tax=Vanrija pseudolonga TaxID=143232 RepID=A0AAF1BEZ9_9TREE|nr:hypothetical protein LOC62_01G000911 [Vanrija pseudolonga]